MEKNKRTHRQELIHQNWTNNNTQQLQNEESAMFVAKKLSEASQHSKLPLYPLQSTSTDDPLFNEDFSFPCRKDDGSYNLVRKNIFYFFLLGTTIFQYLPLFK